MTWLDPSAKQRKSAVSAEVVSYLLLTQGSFTLENEVVGIRLEDEVSF